MMRISLSDVPNVCPGTNTEPTNIRALYSRKRRGHCPICDKWVIVKLNGMAPSHRPATYTDQWKKYTAAI